MNVEFIGTLKVRKNIGFHVYKWFLLVAVCNLNEIF